jgi:DnaK suppressor protein
MAFMFRLEDEDGEPADPPTLKTAVPNWRPGDTIPLGGRTLRVVAVAPRADPDGDGVLVVEDGRTRLGNRRPGRRRGRRARSPSQTQPYFVRYRGLMDPDRARELLAGERQRIERALARLGHEDAGNLADDEDAGNLASDLYQDELDEGLSDDLREELAAVERAEARLAAGTYGLSIESGEPIPDERLEALPTAERTVEEEAQ